MCWNMRHTLAATPTSLLKASSDGENLLRPRLGGRFVLLGLRSAVKAIKAEGRSCADRVVVAGRRDFREPLDLPRSNVPIIKCGRGEIAAICCVGTATPVLWREGRSVHTRQVAQRLVMAPVFVEVWQVPGSLRDGMGRHPWRPALLPDLEAMGEAIISQGWA